METRISSGEHGKGTNLQNMAAKERWDALRHNLGSRMKSLEVLAVLEGVKRVARILCEEESAESTTQFLGSLGLFVEHSDFKLILAPSTSSSFIETSVTASLQDQKPGRIILYVSKEQGKAGIAKQLEENQDHSKFGELLGYPSCCCAFFEEHFSKNHTDLTLDTLEHSEGWSFPFLTNIAARHVDASLLSHFPCSFSCEKSIELAKKLLSVAKIYGQDDVFYLCGQTAVVYSGDEGIIFLQHPVRNGSMVSYSNATSTKEGKLFYLLNGHNRITILGKHSFTAGDDRVLGKHIGVMLFT